MPFYIFINFSFSKIKQMCGLDELCLKMFLRKDMAGLEREIIHGNRKLIVAMDYHLTILS